MWPLDKLKREAHHRGRNKGGQQPTHSSRKYKTEQQRTVAVIFRYSPKKEKESRCFDKELELILKSISTRGSVFIAY